MNNSIRAALLWALHLVTGEPKTTDNSLNDLIATARAISFDIERTHNSRTK
jgi:hypothetical protein